MPRRAAVLSVAALFHCAHAAATTNDSTRASLSRNQHRRDLVTGTGIGLNFRVLLSTRAGRRRKAALAAKQNAHKTNTEAEVLRFRAGEAWTSQDFPPLVVFLYSTGSALTCIMAETLPIVRLPSHKQDKEDV
jgi:hypothetical protein